ncbi:ABC transporter ATP-binding protein [Bacillus cereus]|nr:ABC transporter ATP-binding protein [Bacillus cereus]PGL38324.1 ABC transporter ATP-binding protein [Bacillus cereus]
MGDEFVKLVSLYVRNLYGYFDYNIDFNSDVTFIYGENGCGKTTILNITEAIITGQLYKLFYYDFRKIELLYASSAKNEENKTIRIIRSKNNLKISFNNKDYEIVKGSVHEGVRKNPQASREVFRYYFDHYDFLNTIKQTFNYVYLPLNRSSVLYEYEDDSNYYLMRRLHGISSDGDYNNDFDNRDIAMMKIESLINFKFSRINSTITKFSDDFRNEILKSLLEVNRQYSFENLVNDILKQRNTVSELQKTKTAYIKILKELELINKTEEEKYNSFFAEFIHEFSNFQKNESNVFPLDLVTKFQEISKIKNLVTIAEKMELRKSLARKPIEIFLSTMKEFIGDSEDGKEIIINQFGRIEFITKYSNKPISIQYLSSGEKQLVTFFANLIFSVKSSTSGIFVVDEPEISLHLSWQKKFVEKTLEINKNIQLIFATHSPEIIGRNRNKMYKLEKKYGEKVELINE